MDQKTRCMQFLYQWVSKGHMAHIRKNMVEELQAFVNEEISNDQAQRTAARIKAEQDREAELDREAVGGSIVDSVDSEFKKDQQ